MKLVQVHVMDFQSIRDSNDFNIGDITCLVGKNESGKSALLQALYRLNPIIENDDQYSITDDYPRWDVEDYRHSVEQKHHNHAIVVRASFYLEKDDVEIIEEKFGTKTLTKMQVTLSRGYENKTYFEMQVDALSAIQHVISNAQLLPETQEALSKITDIVQMLEELKKLEQTAPIKNLITFFDKINNAGGIEHFIFKELVQSRIPKFLYFDEYYQMVGHANIDALKQRKQQNKLVQSDYPLLGLINLARLDLDQLQNPSRTRELKNRLEGAGNHLTKSVLKYWSQNRHLQLRFDVRPARPDDPAGMQNGTNIWGEVYDTDHMVTTELGTRSRGFVWFFSFLAWYSDIQHKNQKVILLLDEPGLFLHAKAQMDLLNYFEVEIKDQHQLIYTTHSPFMVDPKHYERVRIVQDLSIDSKDPTDIDHKGTKVLTDVLEATCDSLFPLQGALGYEISQNLFIGSNSLIVEGVSDLLYLQTISGLLQQKERTFLDPRWTITPVDGLGKVPTFVALLGSQKGLNIAVLVDCQKKDQQVIENLFKRKLLKKNNVLTFAEFVSMDEADIEDMFDVELYLDLVSAEYEKAISGPIATKYLRCKSQRILVALDEYFKDKPLKSGVVFNHYRPARYFTEHVGVFSKNISDATLSRFEEMFKKLNSLIK